MARISFELDKRHSSYVVKIDFKLTKYFDNFLPTSIFISHTFFYQRQEREFRKWKVKEIESGKN